MNVEAVIMPPLRARRPVFWVKLLLALVIILLPVLLLLVVLPLHKGLTVADLIPRESDEIYYWRQVDSFLHSGFNNGYYTYAERTALVGHYYAWSLFVPLVESTLARPFGWSLTTIPVMSAVLLSLALAVFIWTVKPDGERLIWLGAALVTFAPLWLYHLTSMLEMLQYAAIVLVAAVFYGIMRSPAPTRRQCIIGLVIVVCAALLRETTGLLLIPLGLLMLRRPSLRRVILVLIGSGVLVGATYLTVMLTAAPYPNVLSQFEQALNISAASGLMFLQKNIAQNQALFTLGDPLEIARRWEVIGILIVLLAAGLLRALSRFTAARRKFVIGLPYSETGFYLFNLGLIFLILGVVYDLQYWHDYRVLSVHLLLMLLLLVAFRRRALLIPLIALAILLIPRVWVDYQLRIRYQTAAADRVTYVEWRQKLATVLVYQPEAPNAWCNTLLHSAYYFDSPQEAVLLAVDDGIGLSFFVARDDLTLPLKSRYLLLDDAFYAQMSDQLNVTPLLDVPGGKLYLNHESACTKPDS